MCYSDEARPPQPPIDGVAASQGGVTLTASDGNRVMAFAARAAAPTGVGMVALPDVRGLHSFYEELAVRFAKAGIDSVAIDYFGRTAGPGSRDEGFVYRPHVDQSTPAGVAADVAAAIDRLKATGSNGSSRSVSVSAAATPGDNRPPNRISPGRSAFTASPPGLATLSPR